MLRKASRTFMLILTLAALPLLVGSKCVFIFSSGGGSDHHRDDRKDNPDNQPPIQPAAASSGRFGDPPVQGMSFASGSQASVTGGNGEFQFESGNTVRFFIGDINLGAAVAAKSLMAPKDLVVIDGTPGSPAATNISRLLLSLDSTPGDGVVNIPQSVRTAAVRSNESVSSAIEFLDFADDAAFDNAASHLVAVLTSDYPFTATLVDAQDIPQGANKSPASTLKN